MLSENRFLCHSEERSDEESFRCRDCEEPSLTLRMTWDEICFGDDTECPVLLDSNAFLMVNYNRPAETAAKHGT